MGVRSPALDRLQRFGAKCNRYVICRAEAVEEDAAKAADDGTSAARQKADEESRAEHRARLQAVHTAVSSTYDARGHSPRVWPANMPTRHRQNADPNANQKA